MLKILIQTAIAVMKRRKILPYLLLTTLLVGCNNEEKTPTEDGGEIVFNLSVDGEAPVQSRAVADIDFITYGFDIAGYGTSGQFESNVNDLPDTNLPMPNIFNLNDDRIAVPHIAKNAEGFYKSPLSKVPLLEGSYLSFFAWGQNKKPADALTGIVESTDSDNDAGFPYLKVIVPAAPTAQFDIVAAKSINHENDYVISAVDLDFNHILAKLTFRASSSTRNQVKIDEVKLTYGNSRVYSGGTFTFGSSTPVGAYSAFTTYQAGQHSLGSSFAEINNGSTSSLGELLLLPQELTDGFATLDITYRVVLYGAVEQRVVKSVPLKALSLALGTNYIITLTINGIQIDASEGSIAPWMDGGTSLPMIGGPRGDVLLLLEGNDAPYTHVDGKKYWLDRSGYNHHCEIIGNVPYNSNEKTYSFPNNTASYVLAPALGNLTAASIQLIAAVNGYGAQNVFFFSDQHPKSNRRVLFTHLPYNGSGIFFDAGQTSGYDRISTYAISAAQLQAYSLYTYRKGGTFMAFSRNDSYHLTTNDKSTNVGTADHNYIGYNFGGTVKYFKLTECSITAAEMSDDYVNVKKRYNLPDEPTDPAALLPPVQDGLILCLDGRSGQETIDGKNVWRDQSESKNHAEIFGSVAHNNNRFLFSGIRGNYMKLINTLGTNQSFTIEFVVKSNSTTASTTLFAFASKNNSSVDREFSAHYPWTKDGVLIDSPYHNGKGADIRLDKLFLNELPYPITDVNQWQVTRQSNVSNGYIGRMNGHTVETNTPSTPLGAMSYNYIGCFADTSAPFIGEVYSLRMYNRVLTDAELNQNRDYDRTIRNIPY